MANDVRTIREDRVKKTVIEMKERYQLWKRDVADSIDGWRFYFAIDTDVILMHLDPSKRGFMPGFTFSDSDDDGRAMAEILAGELGRFLFVSPPRSNDRGLPPESYMIISPHDAEISRKLAEIARDMFLDGVAIDQELRASFPTLKAIFVEFADELHSVRSDEAEHGPREKASRAKLARQLQSQAAELLKLSASRTRSASALTRFSQLRKGIFQNFHNVHIDNSDAYLSDCLPAGWQEEVKELTSQIYRRLLLASPMKGGATVETDAVVLATLEIVNEALFDRKIRVFLLTGSRYLFEALENYRPYRNSNANLRTYPDVFLRHPQWIMAHPEFFGDEKYSGMSFGRWIDLFFPSRAERKLSEVSRAVGSEELRGIPTQWKAFIEVLSAKRSSVSLLEDGESTDKDSVGAKMIDEIARLMEQGELTADGLGKIFKGPAVKSVSDLYLSSSWLGLLDSPAAFLGETKCLPALVFDPPYLDCEDYYNKIKDLVSKDGNHSAGALDELKRVNDKINKLDPSLYHSHVIHAAAYAAKGHWHPALTLCYMALEVADSLDQGDANERRKGREASYLAAVALRRSAGRKSLLEQARIYISQADERRAPGEPKDVRFEGELVTIEVRKLFFEAFVETQPISTDSIPGLAERIELLIEQTRSLNGTQAGPFYPLLRVKEWVLRQAYSNLFNLLLIDFWTDGEALFQQKYQIVLADAEEVIMDEDRVLDPIPWTIFAVARTVALGEPDPGDSHEWIWETPFESRHAYIPGLFKMYQEVLMKAAQRRDRTKEE